MNAYSFWSALRAGLLCAVIGAAALSAQSCRSTSSLRESRTAVRKDSLRQSVRRETVYEPVPTTQTCLALTAGRLLELPRLPEGFGVTAHDGRLSLRAESDGKGGVNITARHDGESRKVVTEEETTSNRILGEAETGVEEAEEKTPDAGGWLKEAALGLLAILLAVIAIKYKLKN